jgi:hypothetical protein
MNKALIDNIFFASNDKKGKLFFIKPLHMPKINNILHKIVYSANKVDVL